MNNKKNSRFMPLMMALSVVVGILIGTFYANHFSGNRLSIINSSSNTLHRFLSKPTKYLHSRPSHSNKAI